MRERHADTLFSDDGTSVDQQVAALLRERGWTIATAESCTGGLLAARITDPPGASDYFPGGVVVYDRAAKEELGVSPRDRWTPRRGVGRDRRASWPSGCASGAGRESAWASRASPARAAARAEKPVGLVCFSVAGPDGSLTRSVNLPGARFDVRDRSTTVALHLVRRLLLGEHD